jgi:hypothetical protein
VAIPTPASDGRLIFALFSSSDLACFDLEGNLQWQRGLGYENPTTRGDVGMASSPLVVGDTLVVQLENQGESFATGLDAATGQTRWRVPREQEATWTSPLRLRGQTPGADLVLLQSRSRLSVHDPRTGRELCDYKGDIHTVATATTVGDCIYLPSEGGLTALRWNPSGRTLATLWHSKRLQIGNASPIVAGGRLYTLKSGGVLVCADAGDAHVLWQLRLKGPFWATPVLADGRLFAVNYEGLVQVAHPGFARRRRRGDLLPQQHPTLEDRRPHRDTSLKRPKKPRVAVPERIEIRPSGPIVGTIRPPGSKSITNRALVCAALADGPSTLQGALDSDDTRVMIDSLRRRSAWWAAADECRPRRPSWKSPTAARRCGFLRPWSRSAREPIGSTARRECGSGRSRTCWTRWASWAPTP